MGRKHYVFGLSVRLCVRPGGGILTTPTGLPSKSSIYLNFLLLSLTIFTLVIVKLWFAFLFSYS